MTGKRLPLPEVRKLVAEYGLSSGLLKAANHYRKTDNPLDAFYSGMMTKKDHDFQLILSWLLQLRPNWTFGDYPRRIQYLLIDLFNLARRTFHLLPDPNLLLSLPTRHRPFFSKIIDDQLRWRIASRFNKLPNASLLKGLTPERGFQFSDQQIVDFCLEHRREILTRDGQDYYPWFLDYPCYHRALAAHGLLSLKIGYLSPDNELYLLDEYHLVEKTLELLTIDSLPRLMIGVILAECRLRSLIHH